MATRIVVTGIGTDVGKTVVSAILTEALKASYWKPVQAGDLEHSDSIKIQNWAPSGTILTEAFRLTEPMSPHAAAAIDGVEIGERDLSIPQVEGNLIIEGAGGLMVPINSQGLTYCDVFQKWNLPVVVVSRHYLGSINHTLMTTSLLKQRNIPVAGLIFVGDEHPTTEEIIKTTTQLPIIGRVPIADTISREFIEEQASREEWQTIQ